MRRCRLRLPSTTPLLAALAALALSACGDSTDPDDTPAAARDIGEMARDEVEAALDALTLPTMLQPMGTSGTGCATASSTADEDGDGIPDDATFTFTAPPCRFPGIRGSTLDVVGQLRVRDPSATTAGFGYEGTLTALRYTLAPDDEDDPSYSVTRNGFRTLSGTVAGLALTTDLQVVRTFTGQPDGAIDEQWTVAFEPESPLQINQALPAGTLDISGTLGWTRGGESLDLTVTTPTPLRYDESCSDTPQRIGDGELRAAGTFDGAPGYVRLRWTECGRDPEIRFLSADD